MEHTPTYIAIQNIIQQGLLSMIFSNLENTLTLLEQRGLVTKAESEDLLSQAEGPNLDTLLNWWDLILANPTPELAGNQNAAVLLTTP